MVFALSIISVGAFADDPGNAPGGLDPDNAPIDGGLSLLAAAGIGYGVKKAREKKKQQQETEADNK